MHVAGTPLPLPNNPVTLHLADYSFADNKPFPKGVVNQVSQEPDTVYLAQQTLLPHRFSGLFWPRKPGWHKIKKSQDSTQFFYVFTDSSFTTWRSATRLTATQNFLKNNLKKLASDESFTTKQPIPAIYFFLTFLAFAGFLWLEEKW